VSMASKLKQYLEDPFLGAMYESIRNAGPIRSILVDITHSCNIRCDGCFFFAEDMDKNKSPKDEAIFDAFIEHDVTLHLLIAQASHNAMILRLIKSIRETLRTTVWEGHRRRTKGQIEYIQQLHEAMVAGIEAGNPEKAGEAMANHFRDAIFVIWRM